MYYNYYITNLLRYLCLSEISCRCYYAHSRDYVTSMHTDMCKWTIYEKFSMCT